MHEQHAHSSVERGGTLTKRTQDGAVRDARISFTVRLWPFSNTRMRQVAMTTTLYRRA